MFIYSVNALSDKQSAHPEPHPSEIHAMEFLFEEYVKAHQAQCGNGRTSFLARKALTEANATGDQGLIRNRQAQFDEVEKVYKDGCLFEIILRDKLIRLGVREYDLWMLVRDKV